MEHKNSTATATSIATTTEEAMTEEIDNLIESMQAYAEDFEAYAMHLKCKADALECSRDARSIYNTLGPIDAAVDALKNAVGRLEG